MKRRMAPVVIAVVACLAGGAGAADTMPPGARIISVRPAIPEGAKAFVEQQRKLEQERNKKPLFGEWFKKKPTVPPGYETPPPPKPASGKSFWDIFNPKKWGKPKPPPAANQQGQQAPQMQQLQQNQPQGNWMQQGGQTAPLWNPPAAGQIQPVVPAPTSQPG